MTDFAQLLDRLGTLDPVLIGLGLIGLLLLVLLFRRPRDQAGPLRDALTAKELELRDAQTGAGRSEALAEERKTEIDRLNGDLSKLRVKLDADAERASQSAARISGLETELRGAQEEAGRAATRHQSQLEERKAELDRLNGRIAELMRAEEARSEEISALQSRISRLDAELRAAGTLAETTAARTAEALADLRGQIAERDGQVRDLRTKLDQAGAEKQALTGQVNKLQAELKAQGEAAAEKIEILSRVRADMEAKFTAVAGTAPREVRALHPRVCVLAPLDRTMLSVLLDMVYPGQRADSALAALPVSARVSRLDPDRATLALRAANPEAAVRAITEALCPPPSEGAGWAEFPLPKSVRDPLEAMIRDLRDWQEGRIGWRDVARGPLLVGPPGSGKTQLARLIGQEAGIAVVAGSVAQWSSESSRSGDMIRAMRAAFATAAEQAPALLFLDEVDAFGDRARPRDHNSAYTDYIVTALIDLLDGYEGHEGVIVMAATNHPEKLDRAIVRRGRFDRILSLPHPDVSLLPKALRWQLGADLPDADLSAVAQAALGMSGADIAAAVRSARGAARRDRRDLTLDDLAAAITEARPPLHPELRRIVAAHEAGHAIVGAATGRARVSTVALAFDGGFTAASLADHAEDRPLVEAHLAINLAGRAAEQLIFGRITTGAGGAPESDLAKATRLATALESSWGLGESLIWLGPVDGGESRLRNDPGLRARVESHLRNAEARATRILTANRKLLVEMSATLEATGVLSGPALAALLDRVVREPEDGRAPQDTTAAHRSATLAQVRPDPGAVPSPGQPARSRNDPPASEPDPGDADLTGEGDQ